MGAGIVPFFGRKEVGPVAEAVPKLRRVISKARELPLAVELPTSNGTDNGGGVDLKAAFQESKNFAVAVKQAFDCFMPHYFSNTSPHSFHAGLQPPTLISPHTFFLPPCPSTRRSIR